MGDPTNIGPSDITVVESKVIAVDTKGYSVDIISEGPGTLYAKGVPWSTPYRHPDGGGIDFIPEVGATCWTLWHPYDSFPVILGFSSPAHKSLEWSSGRRELNPGDIIMWTRDDNRMILRRGGNIEIVSSKECQRVYIRARGAIEDLCKTWLMTTRGGELSWFTDDSAMSSATGARSVFRVAAKKFGQDAGAIATLSMGGLDIMDPTTLERAAVELVVGTNPLLRKFKMTIGEYGTVETSILDASTTTVTGNVSLTSRKGYTATATTDIKFESRGGSIKLISRAGTHTVEAVSSKETLKASKHISAKSIMLGTNPTEPAVLGLKLLQWLATHGHPTFGAPPAQGATLPTMLSKSVVLQ